jgi:hypothetical protein
VLKVAALPWAPAPAKVLRIGSASRLLIKNSPMFCQWRASLECRHVLCSPIMAAEVFHADYIAAVFKSSTWSSVIVIVIIALIVGAVFYLVR